MRKFKFDPATGRAMLNGKPYFMRGSNITLYRFFEDSECGNLPWEEKWVRLLHQRVKDMHWNCLRYCIGFPPEAWYDIADEAGILIDDEFPIWYGGKGWSKWCKGLDDRLAVEYREWVQDRWNHPCVAIWDANNETISDRRGHPAGAGTRSFHPAVGQQLHRPAAAGRYVRVAPVSLLQCELQAGQSGNCRSGSARQRHPQRRQARGGHQRIRLAVGQPRRHADHAHAQLYRNLVGENATAAQRFHVQATYTAAETEFWRAHRHAAAVMHFTTLGYSRPDGQTCDHWTKGGVARLQWEPEFHKYVRDAFAPVGLMVDYWSGRAVHGAKVRVPVMLLNDLDQAWQGPVALRLKCGERVLFEAKQDCRLEPLGEAKIGFDVAWPEEVVPCALEAELRGADGEPVHSVRDIEIIGAPLTVSRQECLGSYECAMIIPPRLSRPRVT